MRGNSSWFGRWSGLGGSGKSGKRWGKVICAGNLTFSLLSFHFHLCFLLVLVLLQNVITEADGGRHSGGSLKKATPWKTLDGLAPKIYGHRGEKVLLPQHTIPGYKISGILGADFVEPDVVLTKDFVFVCHHNLDLGSSTNVESFPEYYSLRRDDGKWYIQDFTLGQIKMLRLKQEDVVGVRPGDFDGFFSIPTFEEFVVAMHEINYKMKKSVGIIPELKEPGRQNELAGRGPHYMERRFLEELRRFGYGVERNDTENCGYKEHKIQCPPVIIQSFEIGALEFLRPRTQFQLMMLVMDDYRMLTRDFVGRSLPKFANYLGIWKEYLHGGAKNNLIHFGKSFNQTEVDKMGGFVNESEYGRILHGNKMRLAVFTIYDSREASHWGCASEGGGGGGGNGINRYSKAEELKFLLKYGVDGMFVENVAEAREAVRDFGVKYGCSACGMGGSIYVMLFSVIAIVIKDV